jgi:hypothetical protein
MSGLTNLRLYRGFGIVSVETQRGERFRAPDVETALKACAKLIDDGEEPIGILIDGIVQIDPQMIDDELMDAATKNCERRHGDYPRKDL